MGNCDGTWESTVHNDDDGTLDLDFGVHEHSGGRRDQIQVACGGGQIVINKTGHVYRGTLISDGFYRGRKMSHRRKKKDLDDEPTDGTWTAQQIPGEEGLDKGKKKGKKSSKKSPGKAAAKSAKKAGGGTKKKSAKATKKRAQKAAKRGTKKAAKSAKKK